MASSHATDRLAALAPDRETLLYAAVVLNTELLFLLLYLLVTETTGDVTAFYLYPLVWLNVGAWVLSRTEPSPADRTQRRTAGAIAVAYFALLATVGGLLGPGSAYSTAPPIGLDLTVVGVPGLAPRLYYGGELVSVSLIPSYVVGYAALSYLVYATVIDASRATIGGLLGLFSCVSCTWPLIVSAAAVVTGGSASAAIAGVPNFSVLGIPYYWLSTTVFVATVALLYWRPFGR